MYAIFKAHISSQNNKWSCCENKTTENKFPVDPFKSLDLNYLVPYHQSLTPIKMYFANIFSDIQKYIFCAFSICQSLIISNPSVRFTPSLAVFMRI